jgi:hypothetical protein
LVFVCLREQSWHTQTDHRRCALRRKPEVVVLFVHRRLFNRLATATLPVARAKQLVSVVSYPVELGICHASDTIEAIGMLRGRRGVAFD